MTNTAQSVKAKSEGLTFDEAIKCLMEPGIKVKLPEWTGYWFSYIPDKKTLDEFSVQEGAYLQIMVMTKNGDILDTPWTEIYQHRNDWQITDGKLGFDWAINALKNGKAVRRSGWNGKGMFIFLRPGDQLSVEMVVEKVKSLPQSVKDYYSGWLPLKGTLIRPDGSKENTAGEMPFIEFTPYLCMKAANGEIVNGWLASQTDMLAEDWELAQ